MTIYGIKNCNTVKNAIDWLKKNSRSFEFHDYKTKGVSEAKLKEWSKQVGWETLVNRKGTTWRQLGPSGQEKVKDEKSAIQLMLDKTSVIKRPLIEHEGKVIALGFDEREYENVF